MGLNIPQPQILYIITYKRYGDNFKTKWISQSFETHLQVKEALEIGKTKLKNKIFNQLGSIHKKPWNNTYDKSDKKNIKDNVFECYMIKEIPYDTPRENLQYVKLRPTNCDLIQKDDKKKEHYPKRFRKLMPEI